MDTTTIAPLTRREAREIERRTGRRPVAGAVAPTELTLVTPHDARPATVEDTSRIERNDVAALVSVVPTEVIERVAAPTADELEAEFASDIPEAFRGRAVSVRAARPASLIARDRRRKATGLAVAASAAALATAGALLPNAIGGVSEQNNQASLLSAAQAAQEQQSAADDGEAPTGYAPVEGLVAAPDQAVDSTQFSVATFSADEVSEAAPATSTTDADVSTGTDTSGDTSGASAAGAPVVDGSSITNAANSLVGSGAGWTCDQFVRAVFAANGISVGVGVSGIASQAYVIDPSEAVAGDLLVWPGEHIGIYAGGGMMWDNPGYGGKTNQYRSIWGDPVYMRLG